MGSILCRAGAGWKRAIGSWLGRAGLLSGCPLTSETLGTIGSTMLKKKKTFSGPLAISSTNFSNGGEPGREPGEILHLIGLSGVCFVLWATSSPELENNGLQSERVSSLQ